MKKIMFGLVVFSLLLSLSLVVAEEVVTSDEVVSPYGQIADATYKGLTPCALSVRNYNFGLDFFNPIRILNRYCEENAVKPNEIPQVNWNFWHNFVY